MEKIKSDDLLVKILSFLPTKDAVTTSVLSKQWKFLWMSVPKLEYDDSNLSERQIRSMRHYVERNLSLHRAPVIESLRLNLSARSFRPEAINCLVSNEVFRSLHELSVRYLGSMDEPEDEDEPEYEDEPDVLLPSNLYICKSLVALKLEGNILVDVPDHMVCLLSLKTLILQRVTYTRGSLQRLLSNCPALEDLIVERCDRYYWEALRVFIPSLQRLTIKINGECFYRGFVINTPSLKYFKFSDYSVDSDNDNNSYLFGGYEDGIVSPTYIVENMPKLEEAYFDFDSTDIHMLMENFIRQFTSVKQLTLCVVVFGQEALHGEGIVFDKLEHLKICSCKPTWTKLLFWFLKNSPNLLELEIFHNNDHDPKIVDPPIFWNNQLSDALCDLLNSFIEDQSVCSDNQLSDDVPNDYSDNFVDQSVCLNNQLSDITDDHNDNFVDPSIFWNNQLSEVPGCLLWSLQTFKWREFYWSTKEMDLAKYFLKNACCLKNATIMCISPCNPKKKLVMMEELSLSSRGSTSCNLAFD